MRESQYLKTFEDRGKNEGRVAQARADMLRVLQSHLKSAAPEAIRLAIEGTNDLGVLERWFEASLEATSWDDFRKQMKQP